MSSVPFVGKNIITHKAMVDAEAPVSGIEEKANMNNKCPKCDNKGIYPAADGPEDFIMTKCDCGAVPLKTLDFHKRCSSMSNLLVV